MASSETNNDARKETGIALATEALRERLNRLYDSLHSQQRTSKRDLLGRNGLFEYLWDLKEAALMEGKGSVELSKQWLDELEHEFPTVTA